MERIPLVEVDALPPVRAPLLLRLFDNWKDLYRAGLCSRQGLDPSRFVELLPHIWLFDRIDGRWFCRLAGEELCSDGKQLHRRWLEDFIPEPYCRPVQRYFDAVADLRPWDTCWGGSGETSTAPCRESGW